MDKDFMIFRICGQSRWSEDALRKMSYEEVEKIYNDVVYRENLKK